MLAYCDLHIHSCLSPCAQDDMTPANIVGMARVKGLDVIAVTDHNCALNLPAALAAGKEMGVQVLPGLEVTTKEDVHVLAYFEALEDAMAFGRVVDAHLPWVQNQPELFGRQWVMDSRDQVDYEWEKLLLNATDFSLERLCALIGERGGVAVPAHINRGSNGMIGALGLMPMLPAHPLVEVAPALPCPAYATQGRTLLHASDAHRLEDILERVFALEVEEATVKGVLGRFRQAAKESSK
ncbi:MAG: PHP domain-containing protein [Candidatus Limiplasma sp.]|nr:PHP domain-containing protein [Candidatus Limiplasma sp.]